MNKQQFISDINKLTENLSNEQKENMQTMQDLLFKHENDFAEKEFFALVFPRNKFIIGIKERPLTFVQFSLDLNTKEIKKVTSVLTEKTLQLKPLTDPLGNTVVYPPYTSVYSNQTVEIIKK